MAVGVVLGFFTSATFFKVQDETRELPIALRAKQQNTAGRDACNWACRGGESRQVAPDVRSVPHSTWTSVTKLSDDFQPAQTARSGRRRAERQRSGHVAAVCSLFRPPTTVCHWLLVCSAAAACCQTVAPCQGGWPSPRGAASASAPVTGSAWTTYARVSRPGAAMTAECAGPGDGPVPSLVLGTGRMRLCNRGAAIACQALGATTARTGCAHEAALGTAHVWTARSRLSRRSEGLRAIALPAAPSWPAAACATPGARGETARSYGASTTAAGTASALTARAAASVATVAAPARRLPARSRA